METLVAPQQQTSRSSSLPFGEYVRRSAITVGAVSSIILALALIAAPEFMELGLIWSAWGVVMLTVVAAYVSAEITQRRKSGHQSRRTRRWLGTPNG